MSGMATGHATRRIRCFGIVQGVGFRPTVARHAQAAHVTGTVCNKGPYVEIVCQGTTPELDAFERLLREQPPRRATIIRIDVHDMDDAPTYDTFEIVESEREAGAIFVSPDIAICDECAAELFDPTNRRYLHPFINCTNCGPRLTILDELPYDRVRTSMGAFPMCPTCAAEYVDPTCRRYDAQPVCCNACGPQAYLLDTDVRADGAIREARRLLAAGKIVAVKGIGGFHLACDATNEAAVARLRARKRRPAKPFAVMAKDLDTVRALCKVEGAAEELLSGHQRPIVLLDKRASAPVAESVAPGNPRLGVMLPYAPLQLLLFDYPDDTEVAPVLVMTSANESGAPICRDDSDARRELAGLADAILTHDRLIRVRADDTVCALFRGEPYMVRRSRGYAPLPHPVALPFEDTVLAIGGELKCVFAVGTGELCYLSPYVGDLTDVRTVEALDETVRRMLTLLEATPGLIAADLHPLYQSRAVAERLAAERGLGVEYVQHHFAHVVSCMVENELTGPVIGIALDGTGYGTDGSIWGGEVMVADERDFTRVGHIAPFAQPGGDASAREGWRIATALIAESVGNVGRTVEIGLTLELASEQELKACATLALRNINCVRSTSTGRLFDAVAAILGVARASTFEGEAAMALQTLAETWARAATDEARAQAVSLLTSGRDLVRESAGALVLATDALVERLVAARLALTEAGELAWAFHATLAEMVATAARHASQVHDIYAVVLTGGCYQNTLLLELSVCALEEAGLTPYWHHLVPPNDGGIALGQAVVAAARNKAHETREEAS